MRVLTDGFWYAGVGLGVAGVGAVLHWWWLAGLGLLAAGFCLYFFRDPARTCPREPHLLCAPADGKLLSVERVPEGWKLAIFMSPLNVHVNRAPIGGRIERVTYQKGTFSPAFLRKSELNEHNELVIRPAGYEDLPVRMRQVAGAFARRIVCWKREGDGVATGERIGYIKFGSRCEVWLPGVIDLKVEAGQTMRGGSTVLGEFPRSPGAKT